MINTYQKPLIGKNIGIVFGSFAPLHKGHLDMIMRAKKENDGCIVIVCGYDNDKGKDNLKLNKRYRYIREYFENDDLVSVYCINDSELGIAEYPYGIEKWMIEFNNIYKVAVHEDDLSLSTKTWYVGDLIYKKDFESIGEKVILLDREVNKISGTICRENPVKYWNDIVYPFRSSFSHNILITGTASEGKTTLVEDLGKYFDTAYSNEYARDYMIENHKSEWELNDLDYIAFIKGQYELNRNKIKSKENKGVFVSDTDSLITKMYYNYYRETGLVEIGSENNFNIVNELANLYSTYSRWDKIFLLKPHGDFIDDGTRYMGHSNMDSRMDMFLLLRIYLREAGLWDKVTLLEYGYNENFEIVKKYINEVLENGKI